MPCKFCCGKRKGETTGARIQVARTGLSRNSHARGARVSCMLSVLLDAAFLHDFGLDVV